MNNSVKALTILTWIALIFMLIHALMSPITHPVYLKMNNFPELNASAWLITPAPLLSALGCYLIVYKKFIGYIILFPAAALDYLISPIPGTTLIPIILISVPFFITVYQINQMLLNEKKI